MKPNLLVIVTDQLRFDCIGFANAYPVKTPNIDRLFRNGVSFEHAYTSIPLCCPARQTLMHGRRNETFNALWNYDLSLPTSALQPEAYAWPRALQAAGYTTGYVGKWHVHPTYTPLDYGYHHYVADDQYHRYLQDEGISVEFTQGWLGEVNPIDLPHAHTHWLGKQAIRLVGKYAKKKAPWHVRLDFYEPHLPCRPVQQFAEMYKPESIPEWGSFRDEFSNKPYIQRQQLLNWNIEHFTWEDWAPIVARYYAIISQVDDAIGDILAYLERNQLMDNTMIVFTADHGDMSGGHRMMDKHYIMYDDVVRVPFVIHYPSGGWKAGIRSDFIYNTLDLPPTILELLGIEVPEHFTGKSLVPMLNGDTPKNWRQEVVSTYNGQQFGLYTQRMIRTKKWKYVWNTTDIDELYDMEQDPSELDNLIDRVDAKILSELRTRLYDILITEGDRLPQNAWMEHQLVGGHKL